MKKLLLLFIATTLLMSCSSNGVEDIDVSELDGVWSFVGTKIDGVKQTPSICQGAEMLSIITAIKEVEWTTPWNETYPCDFLTYTFSYKISGDKITLKDPEVPSLSVYIKEFSSEILILKGGNWESTFSKYNPVK